MALKLSGKGFIQDAPQDPGLHWHNINACPVDAQCIRGVQQPTAGCHPIGNNLPVHARPALEIHAYVQAIAAGNRQLAQATAEHQHRVSTAGEAAATSITQLEQQVSSLQVSPPAAPMHVSLHHCSFTCFQTYTLPFDILGFCG